MKSAGEAVAAAAIDLIGTPFRLRGRDPRFGIDCVGLVDCALRAAGYHSDAPSRYELRNASIAGHLRHAGRSGLAPTLPPFEAGDIILVTPGPAQHHLLIADGMGGFIHAHAGLRKVVRMPGPAPWPLSAAWRLKSAN